jgi:hypothetical protein
MELKQRVNSSVKLLLLVLIEWSGGEGYGGDRSRVCEGCRRQFPLNLPQSYRSLITPSLAVGILLYLISPPGGLALFVRIGY